MSCSFFEIVGSVCGVDERSRSHTTAVIPLSLCDKDIKSHMKSLQFSGVATEADLILARCGIFERTESFSKMTIWPFHRSSLGIGWRRSSKLCRVPRTASSHSKGGEIRDTKTFNLSRNIVSLQVFVDVSRFSPCVINLTRNKNICCRLKKCGALIG